MPEIHLNRRGINSIEVPEEGETAPGSDLVLQIINHGSPIHISIASANSSPFTDFFHENLYVLGEKEFSVPIRDDAYPGVFSIEIISGYGALRAGFRVIVRERRAPVSEPIAVAPPSSLPVASSMWRPSILAALAVVIAAVFYGLWLVYRIDLLNIAAFVALFLGVILTWLRQRS